YSHFKDELPKARTSRVVHNEQHRPIHKVAGIALGSRKVCLGRHGRDVSVAFLVYQLQQQVVFTEVSRTDFHLSHEPQNRMGDWNVHGVDYIKHAENIQLPFLREVRRVGNHGQLWLHVFLARLPRSKWRLLLALRRRRSQIRAGQIAIGHAPSDNIGQYADEPLAVVTGALIEAAYLLVHLAQQVERVNADVGALDRWLQQ